MNNDECNECGAYLRNGFCFECRDSERRNEGETVEAIVDALDNAIDQLNEADA